MGDITVPTGLRFTQFSLVILNFGEVLLSVATIESSEHYKSLKLTAASFHPAVTIYAAYMP